MEWLRMGMIPFLFRTSDPIVIRKPCDEEETYMFVFKLPKAADNLKFKLKLKLKQRNTIMSSSETSLNPESEYEKYLFVCTFETHLDSTPKFSYVVRSINFSDLLSSSSELRQVAILENDDLPREGGCGVLGSKIVFASGVEPDNRMYNIAITDAYAFDVHDPNQGIVKMPALIGGKHKPLMTEFAGKLYVLAVEEYNNFVSFEVFDPQQGTWSRLPKYPHYGRVYSYAIAGTKLFMSTPVPEGEDTYYHFFINRQDPTIRCFDFASSDLKWRRVPSMCQGGSLPFTGQALVVDLPQPEQKLLFSVNNGGYFRNSLVVHLMSLDENQEDISEIMEMDLPAGTLPVDPGDCHLLHLGGNNVCLVNTCFRRHPLEVHKDISLLIYSYTVKGAAIPFQFEFDISKVDKDRKNCFTVQFQPPRNFEYHIRPDSTFPPHTLGWNLKQ